MEAGVSRMSVADEIKRCAETFEASGVPVSATPLRGHREYRQDDQGRRELSLVVILRVLGASVVNVVEAWLWN